nr:hypothetical protein [Tanacetum cinerariifolium]
MKTPLALPWERIPRLDSGVRIRMPIAATLGCGASVILGRDPVLGTIIYGSGRDPVLGTIVSGSGRDTILHHVPQSRDTVQLKTAVNTISHEYLLEFTSEYGIPETLHPVLPGPKDKIVDFPEGKIGVYTRTNCRSLAADMDLFNLIRAPNPTKVKIGSHPRAPHEVPLLTLTAPRVIEMDETAATDSFGVPSTIERSPQDFAHEAGASDQGAAAPEIPSSEDIPATVASGAGQAEETDTMDPPAAPESRSSHGGKSLAAIQLGLASTVVPEDAPVGVSDPDPLSFADAPSRHSADVAQSSPGIATAGDPESENASSPAKVGSPESVYQPEWGVTTWSWSLLVPSELVRDPAQRMKTPLALPWERIPRLDSGVRIRM